MTGKLYVVATPIGNLEDITLRALRVLREVDLVYAEDTRELSKLLSHFDIATPVSRRHIRDERKAAEEVILALQDGKNVALTTDAGTPGISDPGALIVSEVRMRIPEADIVAIPGASALTAALSIAGLPVGDFVFYGFLPHKKGRETLFKEIAADNQRASVLYESPHRIKKAASSLAKYLEPDRKLTIARELTKIHEEVVEGTVQQIIEFLNTHPDKIRGEFVVIVWPLGRLKTKKPVGFEA